MKKLFLSIVLCLLFSYHIALAGYNTGQYMFTASGNDNNIDSVEALVNDWFDTNNILYHADLEFLTKLEDNYIRNTDDEFSFEFTKDKKSGIWYADEPIKYYSVKAGSQYAMYWVNPALSTGLFSTEDLFVGNENHPDLSHISFWTNENTYTTPEPSTFLLFGVGLLFFVHTRRQKLSLTE